jgi:hypothetical protein
MTTASPVVIQHLAHQPLALEGGDWDELDGSGAALPILLVVAVLALLRYSTRSRN